MRFLRYFSIAVLGVVLVLAAGWWWLLHTSAGARFIWERAGAALDGALAPAELSGDFASGLSIDGFRFTLPGVDIGADSVSLAVDVDLLPLSVEVHDAAVRSLVVDVRKTGAADAAPLDTGQLLKSLRLPVWLLIDDFAIRDARVGLPDREMPLVVERASLRADWRDRIFVDRLEITAERGSLSASGMLELTGRQNFDLAGSLTLRPALAAADDEVRMQLEIAGDLDGFTVETDGNASIGGRGEHSFTASGAGTAKALEIASFSVSGEDVRADGSGELVLEPALSVTASVDLDHADPSPFTEQWPAGHPLSGSLAVGFEPGYLRLEDTHLEAADMRLTLDANIDIAAGDIRADLEWQGLAWPVGAAEPEFSSRTGDLEVSGSPDDWRVDGSFAITLPGFEETSLDLEGQGNRTRAGLSIANAELLGGRVAGSASFAWTGERPWSANLYATDIDTGAIAAEWPGRMSGLLRGTGNIAEQWLRAAVVDVEGSLRNRRFSANGGIEFDRGRFVAHELSLVHGESRFALDGAYWSLDGIGFEMSVADIGHYLDDASGAVSGSGRLSLYEPAPFLRLDASAQLLRVGDLFVSGLEIDDRAGTDSNALEAAIRAADVSFGGERLIEPRFLLSASPEEQTASVSARYRDLAFELRVEGAFDSWKSPSQWQGAVTALEVDAGDAGRIGLLDDAGISLSADAAELSRLCLAGPDEEQLCLEGRWAERERLEVQTSLTQIPVALANRVIDTGYTFDQTISGELRWSVVRGRGADGAGELTVSPGRIVSDRRPELVIRTGTGTLAFDVRDGRLLSGDVALPMPGTGSISGRFQVADLASGTNSDVDGRLDFDIADITLFAIFLPDVDALDGRLNATVDFGGTLAEPRLTGTAKIAGGSVDYLPLGLKLRDVKLDAELDEDRFVAVTGSLRAGKGRAEIMPLEFDAGDRPPGIHIGIRGENLTLVQVPDVSAQSDLDMRVGYDGSRVTLGGRVDVKRARIEPETLPASKQTVSDDVVIVAGELPGEEQGRAEDDLQIHGELAVSLGPDVQLRIDVATATISGTTTFAWSGDPMPVATGRYAISGEVQAFGILLRVDEGTVRFPTVPANNPNLRIRAEREIFGNTQVRQAGVLIEGTLARPRLTPYTDPPTTEERALTLLVTGSDFDFEEGVGAIDFGTYIAPRLYVSYGISLFGQDNVISARYDLTEGFGIRATSGQSDSGVDLVYRIER